MFEFHAEKAGVFIRISVGQSDDISKQSRQPKTTRTRRQHANYKHTPYH